MEPVKEVMIIIPYLVSAIIFALGASVLEKLTVLNKWSSKPVLYTKIIFLIMAIVLTILFVYLFLTEIIL